MVAEEEEIKRLLSDAEQDIETDDFRKAGEKLHQAMQTAKEIKNEELIKLIQNFVQKFSFSIEAQSVELSPIETDGLILDIGGGGAGIIGKLNGRKVVALTQMKGNYERLRMKL